LPSIRITTHSWLRLSLFVACLLSACSDGGGAASLARLGVDDGASSGLKKTGTVSADKGASIDLETGAKVDIPAGAVTMNLKVSMERPADGKALDLVNRLPKAADRIASAPYVLTPHGSKFQQDVTVTLPISKGEAREVSVAWLEDEDDKDWKVLAAAQVEGDKATVKLKHFSVLLLIEDTSGLAHLDAGTGGPDEGPDGVEGDAGVETRDAATPDDRDDAAAMVDPESDAGGDELDASTGTPDAAEPADAAPADAHQLPDGTVTVDGAVMQGLLLTKLDDCSLILQQGRLTEPVLSTPIWRCQYQCLLEGPCLDAQLFYCENGDTAYSVETEACFSACGPTLFTCPDQRQGYFHCDGIFDCANGEDEVGCDPPPFRCDAGNLLPSYERCNGTPVCQGAEDEIGCPVHLCDTTRAIPAKLVCDGVLDCDDGTDEPATCAAVDCAIIF
jgi:Low-density lipoprotein receptor domain class A